MESPDQNQTNPWSQIWIYPRKTMRFILNTNPTRAIIWLAIVWGILNSLSWVGLLWTQHPVEERLQRIIFTCVLLIVGGLLGIVHLYFGGWIYQLTGSWIGGKGKFIETKSAVGWSYYPFIISTIIGLFSYFSIPNPWLQGIFGLVFVVAIIWGFIIFLKLLGEAHLFSAWKALLAFLIAALLIFTAVMIIFLLVPLIYPLFEA